MLEFLICFYRWYFWHAWAFWLKIWFPFLFDGSFKIFTLERWIISITHRNVQLCRIDIVLQHYAQKVFTIWLLKCVGTYMWMRIYDHPKILFSLTVQCSCQQWWRSLNLNVYFIKYIRRVVACNVSHCNYTINDY